jgi:predicted transcriptional regulator
MEKWNERIKKKLDELDISIYALSKKTGIPKSTCYEIVKGVRPPSLFNHTIINEKIKDYENNSKIKNRL